MKKLGVALAAFLVFSGSVARAEESRFADTVAQVVPGPILPGISHPPLIPPPINLEVPPIVDPELPPIELVPAEIEPEPPVFAPMASDWGFVNENAYNALIERSVQAEWTDRANPLPPRLFKALIAVESAFKPRARSWAGAVGLTQLMPEAAQRLGLSLSDRLVPELAVPAGVKVLQEKHQVVMDPLNYWSYLGQPDRCEAWNLKVDEAYKLYGMPQGDDRLFAMLAAYNGGGSTVLRAMAKAHDHQLDPRKWSNLVGPTNRPRNSPLYGACVEVYGRGAWGKYQEISRYPVKIFALYQR